MSSREGMLRSLLTLAASDGKIDQRELSLIDALRKEWGLSNDLLREAVDQAKSGKRPVVVPQSTADQLELLRGLVSVTAADGEVAKQERDILSAVAVRLGLEQRVVDDLLASLLLDAGADTTPTLHEVACAHCEAVQRVPARFLGSSVQCTSCRAEFRAGNDSPSPEDEDVREQRERYKRQLHEEWRAQQEREKVVAKAVVGGAIAAVLLGGLLLRFGAAALGEFVLTALLIALSLAGVAGAGWAISTWWRAKQQQQRLEKEWERKRLSSVDFAGYELDSKAVDKVSEIVTTLVVVPLFVFCCVVPMFNGNSGNDSGASLERYAKEGAIMAPSEEALDRLVAASSDTGVFARVLLSDAYHPLAAGTRVKIMSAGFTVHQVMVMSGPKSGRVGYVLPEALENRP